MKLPEFWRATTNAKGETVSFDPVTFTPTGWICRRCDNGDHDACEEEVRGLYCVCTQGACGE